MAGDGLTDEQQQRAREVVWPWLATLLRTAQYLTRHEQEAEDLVQETVLKAMRAIDQYRQGTDARAWLLTILRRTRVDWIRRDSRRPHLLSLDGEQAAEPAAKHEEPAGHFDPQWDDPEAMMESFSDDQLIVALKSLPEEIRWTLLLVDVEQMDHADASVVLEVPVGTIKSRAHRGRRMLRDRLHELGHAATRAQKGWSP